MRDTTLLENPKPSRVNMASIELVNAPGDVENVPCSLEAISRQPSATVPSQLAGVRLTWMESHRTGQEAKQTSCHKLIVLTLDIVHSEA
jgi:hypothetical protein